MLANAFAQRQFLYIASFLTSVMFAEAYSSVLYPAFQVLKEFNACLKSDIWVMRNNLDFRTYNVFDR